MKLPLSHEEKIDYIYNHIKTQRRMWIFKFILKNSIIIIIVIILNNYYKNVDKNDFIDSAQQQFSDFTYPIIENLLEQTNNNLQKDFQQQIEQQLDNQLEKSSQWELLEKYKQQLQKWL